MAQPVRMGDVSVSITVDKRQVDRMLLAIEHTLMGNNLFEFLRGYMQPYMRERVKSRFASEGDDASGPWAPLLEVTQDIREHFGFPREHPINRRTGELENFLTRGVIDWRRDPSAISMFFPGKPPTHALQQKLSTAQAGRTKPQTVPRPVVAVSHVDMIYFLNTFGFWFAKEVQQRYGGGPTP